MADSEDQSGGQEKPRKVWGIRERNRDRVTGDKPAGDKPAGETQRPDAGAGESGGNEFRRREFPERGMEKRPSFDAAASPEQARLLYEYFVGRIRAAGLRCETGRFQEMMQVELVNQGPVTILLDSSKDF